MTLKLGLLGAGRIGLTHARAVSALDGATIAAVHDLLPEAAARAAALTGARIASAEEILDDPAIDGVMICTPTDLHADQVEMAAKAGKAIFCEKPIDLDLARAEACVDVVEASGIPFMLGFNRRFDPSFAALKAQLDEGAIGKPELVQINSRDPAPPPLDYIRRSGGLFKDMMIHDFDMARFLLGEELEVVSAAGGVLTDPMIGEAGDIDTAIVTLRSESGCLVSITNSRRASYGYDQRIEIHGQKGMLSAANHHANSVILATEAGFQSAPLLDFFMERYAQAYKAEIAAFASFVSGRCSDVPTGRDGVAALRLAASALAAFRQEQSRTS